MQDIYNSITAKCFSKCVSRPADKLDKCTAIPPRTCPRWTRSGKPSDYVPMRIRESTVYCASGRAACRMGALIGNGAAAEQVCLAKCVDRFIDSRQDRSEPTPALRPAAASYALLKHRITLARVCEVLEPDVRDD